jgi:hypothetical protein|tara:strand:+ start:401 stop:541 length:141 start_codon:yes stop_codon:yes gene_type:complete
MTRNILIFLLKLIASDVEVVKKKPKRGRPLGRKDSKPRIRRKKVVA